LLSSDYAARRHALIDARHAHPAMPEPGAIAGFDTFGASLLPQAAEGDPGAGDTSHVCVIDRQGNAFSATPSDGSGTMPVVPGTGLSPSARGSQAWTDARLPAAVAPGKRPRLTPSPAMILREGAVFMPFGASGGDVQPQAMLQFLLNLVVFGMTAQDAVEAPRAATFSFPGSFDPHPYYPGRIQLENRFTSDVTAELAQLGHEIGMWPEFASRAGAVTAIVREPRTGILHGAADPRRPAYVLGW
jgi:gamma-glutamyltranspeptidase/glutathione hydrolase